MKHFIAAMAFALVALLTLGDLTLAHAKLDHCTPVPGTAVATAPSEVRCWYTEEIDSKQSTLIVADANGARVDNNDGHLDLNDPDHKQMFATLKPLATGVYKVTWHTVTTDDNGMSDGFFYFGVGQVAVPTTVPPPASEETVPPAAPSATTAAGTTTPVPTPVVQVTEAPTSTAATATTLAASTSPVPVVIVAGVLEAAVIIGVLAFLYRRT